MAAIALAPFVALMVAGAMASMTAAGTAVICVVAAAAGQMAHGASAQGGLNSSSYVVARDENTAPLDLFKSPKAPGPAK